MMKKAQLFLAVILLSIGLFSLPSFGAISSYQDTVDLGDIIKEDITNDLDDTNVPGLKRGTVEIGSNSYDYFENVNIEENSYLHTALTSGEFLYNDTVHWTVPEGSLEYYYNFDDAINFGQRVRESNATLNMLGKDIKIVDVVDGDTLKVEEGDTIVTYSNGDAFVYPCPDVGLEGCSESSPYWKWVLKDLNPQEGTTNIPTIGVENKFSRISIDNNLPGINDRIESPNRYLSFELLKLNVEDYTNIDIYYNVSTDLSEAEKGNSDDDVFIIQGESERLTLDRDFNGWNYTAIATSKSTDKIFIRPNSISQTNYVDIFFANSSDMIQYAGNISLLSEDNRPLPFSYISYGNIGSDVRIQMESNETGINPGEMLNITINVTNSESEELIRTLWYNDDSSYGFSNGGGIRWSNGTIWTNLNEQVGSYLTKYGINTINPSDTNNATFRIPDRLVKGTFEIAVEKAKQEATNITLVSPKDGSITNDPDVTFTCDFFDENGLKTVYLWSNITGSWGQSASSTFNNETNEKGFFLFSGLDDGTYKWTCAATDSDDNFVVDDNNRTVTVDRSYTEDDTETTTDENVTITFNSPTSSNEGYTKDWVNVDISTENELTNATLEWNNTLNDTELQNYTMTESGTSWSYNITNLTESVYEYRVYTEDIDGNTSVSGTREVIIDSTDPFASLTLNVSSFSYVGDDIRFECDASDNIDDAFDYTVTLSKSGSVESERTSTNVENITGTFSGSDINSTGTRVIECLAEDSVGNNDTSFKTFSVYQKGTTGGGITTNDTTTDDETQDTSGNTWTSNSETLFAETPKDFTVTNSDLDIRSIYIDTSTSISGVQAQVEKLSTLPTGVANPGGEVYSYFDITVTNVNDNIDEAYVQFRVSKSWLSSNNVDETTIRLNRYVTGSGWQALSTQIQSETTSYVEYRAFLPGFSTFSVTGEQIQAQDGNESDQSGTSGNGTETVEQEDEGGSLWVVATIFLILFAVLAGIGVWMWKKGYWYIVTIPERK